MESVSGSPLLIWVHGGGLKLGDKTEVIPFASKFIEKGITLAAPNYRLHPDVYFPVYRDDVADAIAWIIKNHGTEKGLPRKIFLGGYSAGAYLATLLFLDPRPLKERGISISQFSGLISLSGAMSTHSTVRFEKGISIPGIYCDEAAPFSYLKSETPPLLVMVAEEDLPGRAEENIHFVVSMRKRGHQAIRFSLFEKRNHESIIKGLSQEGDPVMNEILEFIQKQL